MKRNIITQLCTLTSFLLLVNLFSCQKTRFEKSDDPDGQSMSSSKKPLDPGFADNEMVMYWNDKVNTVLAGGNQPTRTRYFFIIETAVHDALNNIKPKYQPYALHERTQFASPDAAVASAAYWAIIGLSRQGNFPVDTWYSESLANIPDGESKDLGITLGKHAAEAIIANRADDGFSQTILTSITPPNGTNPGEYRSTITAVNWEPTDNLFGFRILHNWADVMKPYVVETNHQFRAPGPYALNSNGYTADFNEIKTKGARVGHTRTTEEDKIGKFWAENRPSYFWNLIVRKAIENQQLDAWKTARLFALVHAALADDMNTAFDGLYYYYFWRPETAIRLAATDGNSATVADITWTPALSENATSPTIPLPGYSSTFASFSGTVAEMLRLFFGTDETSIDISTTTLNPLVPDPKPSFHFSSFSEMALSNANGMVYNGWDFRKSAMDGVEMGRQIANYVFQNSFREN